MDVQTCARTPAPGHTSAASKTIYARTHIDISEKISAPIYTYAH